MPFLLTGLFRRVPPRDQFVIDLIEALKLRSINVKSYNHEEYALHFEHSAIGPSIVGLNNLFLIWQSRGRDEKKLFLQEFVESPLVLRGELGRSTPWLNN